MRKKRVLVAMSGGVDSSVSAYLLSKEGYEVIGVSMKFPLSFSESNKYTSCCGFKGIEDAKKVAEEIGIPFYILNYEEKFERKVIEYFIREYKMGRTPNPCIVCNKKIKFGELLKLAKHLGIDYVATGHYVKKEKEGKKYLLKKGIDPEKDQSYFLFSLNQYQLKNSLFPVGNYRKEEVRKIAKEIGLNIHSKPQSQEICFIQDKNYRDFLIGRNSSLIKPGPIINKEGKVLGEHKGIVFYTIGQRTGLGISHTTPLYVIKIDKNNNTIIVGEEKEIYKRELVADNVNLILYDKLEKERKVTAKIRYKQEESEAVIIPLDDKKIKVIFSKPQRAITPGQAIVFYEGETVLGGGIILE